MDDKTLYVVFVTYEENGRHYTAVRFVWAEDYEKAQEIAEDDIGANVVSSFAEAPSALRETVDEADEVAEDAPGAALGLA